MGNILAVMLMLAFFAVLAAVIALGYFERPSVATPSRRYVFVVEDRRLQVLYVEAANTSWNRSPPEAVVVRDWVDTKPVEDLPLYVHEVDLSNPDNYRSSKEVYMRRREEAAL